jgi:hypothetical protein
MRRREFVSLICGASNGQVQLQSRKSASSVGGLRLLALEGQPAMVDFAQQQF